MAEIPKETVEKILELMGRLSISIDTASSTELSIFNAYGETDEMVYVLEQLQNTKERGISSYCKAFYSSVKDI